VTESSIERLKAAARSAAKEDAFEIDILLTSESTSVARKALANVFTISVRWEWRCASTSTAWGDRSPPPRNVFGNGGHSVRGAGHESPEEETTTSQRDV
jgi:hypothetical protein